MLFPPLVLDDLPLLGPQLRSVKDVSRELTNTMNVQKAWMRQLEDRIAEPEARLRRHSVPPSMLMKLWRLEEELAQLVAHEGLSEDYEWWMHAKEMYSCSTVQVGCSWFSGIGGSRAGLGNPSRDAVLGRCRCLGLVRYAVQAMMTVLAVPGSLRVFFCRSSHVPQFPQPFHNLLFILSSANSFSGMFQVLLPSWNI